MAAAEPVSGIGSPLARRVEAFRSDGEPVLRAILRFGRENNLALGVIVGDQLCSTRITRLSIQSATAEAVLKRLLEMLPSYRWDVEDGTIVISPDHITNSVARFLEVVPPRYVIPADTLQGQVVWAWMDIRAALKPGAGTAFSILSSSESIKWPALNVQGLTIRQLLNRLVARNKGGAWVLFPFPDFNTVADKRPFWLLDYTASGPIEAMIPNCVGRYPDGSD